MTIGFTQINIVPHRTQQAVNCKPGFGCSGKYGYNDVVCPLGEELVEMFVKEGVDLQRAIKHVNGSASKDGKETLYIKNKGGIRGTATKYTSHDDLIKNLHDKYINDEEAFKHDAGFLQKGHFKPMRGWT